MIYKNVCLETIAYTLPDEVVTSADIEARLEPLYRRLRLPEGRLELMTGITERRFWPADMPPSAKSIETAEKALSATGIDRCQIGALIHGSVCRDFLEPATACGVHHRLGLSNQCVVYDVSNACLGLLNGAVQIANMIELGQIQAGIVVGTENGRTLVDSTIEHLNTCDTLTRQDIKGAFASLTIGAGSAAIVLCHRDISRTGNRLLGGALQTATEHCELCQGGQSQAGLGQGQPLLMDTDSETLMREGVAAAQATFAEFCRNLDWQPSDINKTVCHQVGRAHQRLLFESLGLSPKLDFTTFNYLGNTGSVALPMTAALAAEAHHFQPRDRVALLGIGSGINVIMLGVEWHGGSAE